MQHDAIPPDEQDLARYHRQMLLPEFGADAQSRLAQSRVLLIGCGALGCVVADLLVRAGVGHLTIVDRDVVELTNLQRQTLYTERDAHASMPKAEAAAARLRAVNSSVQIEPIIADFSPRNAEMLLREERERADVIVDGTDNFETRFLMNDLAFKHGVPWVYGGAIGTSGRVAAFVPGRTCCIRCLLGEPPAPGTQPTCDTAGVFGPTIGIVGAAQTGEAIKVLAGRIDRLAGSMLAFDQWRNARQRINLKSAQDPACPCCAKQHYEYLDPARAPGATVLCGSRAVQVMPADPVSIELSALADRLARVGAFSASAYCVRGRVPDASAAHEDPVELTVFADGRALVKGVETPERARAIYAKYVGL